MEVETDFWMNESKDEIHESNQHQIEQEEPIFDNNEEIMVLDAEVLEPKEIGLDYSQENAGFAPKMSRKGDELSLGCNQSSTKFKGSKQLNSGGDNYPGLLNKTSKIEQIRARAQRETINRQYFESVEEYDDFVGKYKLYLIGLGKKEIHANGIIALMEKRIKDGDMNYNDREAISRYRSGTLSHQSEKQIEKAKEDDYIRRVMEANKDVMWK